MKLIGLLSLFLICTAAGLGASLRLSKRVGHLEAFIAAMGLLSTEIRYNAPPVAVLLEKLDAAPEFGRLRVFGFCRELLRVKQGVFEAWPEALALARPSLSIAEGDAEVLLAFGRAFGATDVEGQLANCESCRAQLQSRLEEAREEKLKRGRMYSSLGVLAGLFLVILLF